MFVLGVLSPIGFLVGLSTLRYSIFICPVSGGIFRDPEGFVGSDKGPFGRGFIWL